MCRVLQSRLSNLLLQGCCFVVVPTNVNADTCKKACIYNALRVVAQNPIREVARYINSWGNVVVFPCIHTETW